MTAWLHLTVHLSTFLHTPLLHVYGDCLTKEISLLELSQKRASRYNIRGYSSTHMLRFQTTHRTSDVLYIHIKLSEQMFFIEHLHPPTGKFCFMDSITFSGYIQYLILHTSQRKRILLQLYSPRVWRSFFSYDLCYVGILYRLITHNWMWCVDEAYVNRLLLLSHQRL